MLSLIIIMFVTVGLAMRAVMVGSRFSPADVEADGESDLYVACARTSLVVLICLIGLLALGLIYGNVLGGTSL
jgi:hypothetical protein